MNSKLIVPVLIAALVIWRIYMRMRRSFGRQRVRSKPMIIRSAVLALIACALLVMAGRQGWTLLALLLGGACGVALASIGLRYTRFELTAQGRFYTPHGYIGLAVTVLFLARLAYDYLVLYHGMAPSAARHLQYPQPGHYTPLTLAVSGAFIAYYLAYYIGVLRRSGKPATLDGKPIQQEPGRQ